MPTLSVYKLVWRCCLSVLVIGLVGCATGPDSSTQQALTTHFSTEPAQCHAYRSAWVELFKANVKAMSDNTQLPSGFNEALDRTRQQMATAGVDKQDCSMPYCMIQPLQGGKLNSYCGYRLPAEPGGDLYRWMPWTGQ